MPSVIIRLEVLPETGGIPSNFENICQAKKVIVVDSEVIPKLNKIIAFENLPPLFRSHKQLAMASKEARMIAVSPPKNKKERKIAASEKLTEKFDRGIFKLSLELTVRVKVKSKTKLQLIILALRLRIANAKHTPPMTVIAVLKNVEIFSGFINRKDRKRRLADLRIFSSIENQILELKLAGKRRELIGRKILPEK